MRWLVRLVTPPGGTVLDPFAGSGATVEAALLEGFDCMAIEQDADYLPLIQIRIDRCRDVTDRADASEPTLFDEDGAGMSPDVEAASYATNADSDLDLIAESVTL
jgi:hypothetical protein